MSNKKQIKKKEYTFNEGDIKVTIPGNGNVPFYDITRKDESYKVKFSALYEIVQKNQVGGSRISLPSLSWTMNKNSNTTFTMTGSGKKQLGGIKFTNHIVSGNDNGVCKKEVLDECQRQCNATCETNADPNNCYDGCKKGVKQPVPDSSNCITECDSNNVCIAACDHSYNCAYVECKTHIKFDVFITSYNFVSSSSDAKLVLEYQVIGKGSDKPSKKGDKITFGDLWLTLNNTAFQIPSSCSACSSDSQDTCFCGDNNKVEASIDSSDSGSSAFVQFQYDKFTDGNALINDPTFGFSSSSSTVLAVPLFFILFCLLLTFVGF